MLLFFARLLGATSILLAPISIYADESSENDEIDEITVNAQRVANQQPAATYASAATALRYDPLTELQSRGLAEGQSDVTVRGGLFENTGFKLGAVTIMDPQTGHYVAELPVDPASLSAPAILKGIDAALAGFNSAIATIHYSLPEIQDGGYVGAGAGSDSLNFQSLRLSKRLRRTGEDGLGLAISAARSEGDGSLPFGDHEFSRLNLQLQVLGYDRQTDFLASYQDKFYGWPGAYTGFATLPEIDDTQTTLLFVNHRRDLDSGFFEVGAYHRRLEDDYDFNRTTIESGAPGSFEHETKVFGVGVSGLYETGSVDWHYGGQLTHDELVFSTDLTNGPFDQRTYLSLRVAPTIETELSSGNTLIWQVGASYDYTNRDGGQVAPLLGVSVRQDDAGGVTTWSLEYAETTQVPGYTALKSNPTGLFGGNPALARETAQQLVASWQRDSEDWQARVALFARQDDDLVDWTFTTGAPFARQANAVDIDVTGVEAFLVRNWETLDLALGLTVIDKDADYGSAVINASFYALNFAKQRATVAVTWRFANAFELKIDNEYRVQEDNPLRVGDDNAYLASAALRWTPPQFEGLEIALVADNVSDSEHQPFPGTPASGRQYSLGVSYSW